jgi:tetratricopeptide (TPR) repeat protein
MLLGWLLAASPALASPASPLEAVWQAVRADQLPQALARLDALPPVLAAGVEGRFLRGLVLLRLERPAEAAPALATVPLDHALGLAARLNRALALIAAGDPAGARTALRDLVDRRARIPAARREAAGAVLYNAALALLARGRADLARETLQDLERALPGTRAARQAGALLAADPGRPPEAAVCVTDYRARRYAAARACFERLLRATGPDATILYAVGYAAFQQGDHAAAEAAFDRTLLLSPRDGDARFMRALCLAHRRAYPEAVTELEAALAAGLSSEDPAEARRYLAKLRPLLVRPLRSAWILEASVSVGYDSYPLLGGSAATASSGAGATGTGTGFDTVAAAVGYRWIRREAWSTTLRYHLEQVLVWQDLQGLGGASTARRAGSGAAAGPTTEVSLQSHGVDLGTRWVGRRLSAGGGLGAGLELVGLRTLTPLAATLALDGLLEWRAHRLTSTRLGLVYAPQWGLDDAVAYLTGHGVAGQVAQVLHVGRRLELSLGYRGAYAGLGRFVQPVADCPAGEPCALDVPYANHQHRGTLSLLGRPWSWLVVTFAAALEGRYYVDAGTYRLVGGGTVERVRRDLGQSYALEFRFRLARGLELSAGYRFTRNRSTIQASTTGIDEGYDRHRAELSLAYRRP